MADDIRSVLADAIQQHESRAYRVITAAIALESLAVCLFFAAHRATPPVSHHVYIVDIIDDTRNPRRHVFHFKRNEPPAEQPADTLSPHPDSAIVIPVPPVIMDSTAFTASRMILADPGERLIPFPDMSPGAPDTIPRLRTACRPPDISKMAYTRTKQWLIKEYSPLDNTLIKLGPGYCLLYYDLFPIFDKPDKDERKRYRTDLLGIELGRGVGLGIAPGYIGFNALGLVNTARHAWKTAAWKREEKREYARLSALREAGFAELSEKEIAFLNLMWRHGDLNPKTLAREEREYLSAFTAGGIVPHAVFLKRMERKGLISSTMRHGILFYSAKVSRDDLVRNYLYLYHTTGDKMAVTGKFDLITKSLPAGCE